LRTEAAARPRAVAVAWGGRPARVQAARRPSPALQPLKLDHPPRRDPARAPPDNTRFKFGVLTKQNAAWATLGVNIFGSKFSPADLVQDTDELFIVA
jgi:hypothetical protein